MEMIALTAESGQRGESARAQGHMTQHGLASARDGAGSLGPNGSAAVPVARGLDDDMMTSARDFFAGYGREEINSERCS